jgi:hypothetical protein
MPTFSFSDPGANTQGSPNDISISMPTFSFSDTGANTQGSPNDISMPTLSFSHPGTPLAAEVVKVVEMDMPGRFTYDGKQWTKNSTGKYSAYYVCPHDRLVVNPCLARLIRTFDPSTGNYSHKVSTKHTCDIVFVLANGMIDITKSQREYIQDHIGEYLVSGKQLSTIAREIDVLFTTQYKGVPAIALDVRQIFNALKEARRREAGSDWKVRIMQHPMGTMGPGDTRPLTQFVTDVYIPDKNGVCKEKHTIVGFAHPDILFRLRHTAVHGFIDGTFDCMPSPFVQVLILMGYDEPTQTNVPLFFILLDCKLEAIYVHAFQLIILACGGKKNIKFKKLTAGKKS